MSAGSLPRRPGDNAWVSWASENGIYSLSSGSCFSPNPGGKAFVLEAVKQD